MLFSANVAVEQGVIVTAIAIAFFMFTLFWCTPTHVQSKPSCSLSLKHRHPK